MQQVSMQFMLFLVTVLALAVAFLAKVWNTTTAKVAAFFLGTSSVAFAAVPASVTTGISDAVADVGTVGSAILAVVIAIAAFMWIRHVIK